MIPVDMGLAQPSEDPIAASLRGFGPLRIIAIFAIPAGNGTALPGMLFAVVVGAGFGE